MSKGQQAKLFFIVAFVINCILFSQSRYGGITQNAGSSSLILKRTLEISNAKGLGVLPSDEQVSCARLNLSVLGLSITLSADRYLYHPNNSALTLATFVPKTIPSFQYLILKHISAPIRRTGS
jgi:hypothetical protein